MKIGFLTYLLLFFTIISFHSISVFDKLSLLLRPVFIPPPEIISDLPYSRRHVHIKRVINNICETIGGESHYHQRAILHNNCFNLYNLIQNFYFFSLLSNYIFVCYFSICMIMLIVCLSDMITNRAHHHIHHNEHLTTII